MANDRNIVLAGFMGTGKTVVGLALADRLSRPFIDTDQEIIRHAGRSIPEIFAAEGESAFRQLEGRMCRFYASQRGFVVATGGGMLVDESNRRVMLASGFVVCLTASPDVIAARLDAESSDRPLLRSDWRALLESRLPAYDTIPHRVDTSQKTPQQVVEEVISLWQNASS